MLGVKKDVLKLKLPTTVSAVHWIPATILLGLQFLQSVCPMEVYHIPIPFRASQKSLHASAQSPLDGFGRLEII